MPGALLPIILAVIADRRLGIAERLLRASSYAGHPAAYVLPSVKMQRRSRNARLKRPAVAVGDARSSEKPREVRPRPADTSPPPPAFTPDIDERRATPARRSSAFGDILSCCYCFFCSADAAVLLSDDAALAFAAISACPDFRRLRLPFISLVFGVTQAPPAAVLRCCRLPLTLIHPPRYYFSRRWFFRFDTPRWLCDFRAY
jgi:hypothetical protein